MAWQLCLGGIPLLLFPCLWISNPSNLNLMIHFLSQKKGGKFGLSCCHSDRDRLGCLDIDEEPGPAGPIFMTTLKRDFLLPPLY
jgi:hypothetical protein